MKTQSKCIPESAGIVCSRDDVVPGRASVHPGQRQIVIKLPGPRAGVLVLAPEHARNATVPNPPLIPTPSPNPPPIPPLNPFPIPSLIPAPHPSQTKLPIIQSGANNSGTPRCHATVGPNPFSSQVQLTPVVSQAALNCAGTRGLPSNKCRNLVTPVRSLVPVLHRNHVSSFF